MERYTPVKRILKEVIPFYLWMLLISYFLFPSFFIIGPIFCLIYGLSLMKNNAIIVDEHEIILKRLLRTDILVSVHDINQFEFRTVRFRRGYDFTFHIHTDLKSIFLQHWAFS